jgi:diguanylate cyclase (GGDEF)-like protein
MPSKASSKTTFAFLDSHAQVIERLLPDVRAVAFFDARGTPLRGRGPVSLSQVRSQVRSALQPPGNAAEGPRESVAELSPGECAAALLLYTESEVSARAGKAPPVAGLCLIVIRLPDAGQPPSLESLHAQLDPALMCVGYQLAQVAGRLRSVHPADTGATELDWLLEIGTPPDQDGQSQAPLEQGERLAQIMTASVAHLQCVLGALLVPSRQLRLVRAADGSRRAAEEALQRLESPLLNWVRRKKMPLVVNRSKLADQGAAAGSPPPLRVLAVPVTARGSEPEGVLVLLRSMDAPAFSRVQLSLAKHLSRQISSLLGTTLDVLTGLHMRSGAQSQVDAWGQAGLSGSHSVIFIDIDQLHVLNETSGFDAGDALILGVARLLREPQLSSNAVAARISGDEFVIALPGADSESAALTAKTLQQATALLPQAKARRDEPASLSCGIAGFSAPNEFESALALAQLACRTAKDRGRGRVEIYQDNDASMIRRQTDSISVLRLREALRNDQLTLYAQRIMPLQRQEDPEAYELLLRSLDETQANRAPADLLSAAHRNHMTPALDMWVAEHALAQAAPHASVLKAGNVSLSINITGPSLTDEWFLEGIQRLLRRSPIPPSLVTFEITETVAVLSLAKAVTFIRTLRTMGCRFALDDFGTGANSLKNLTNLPVDRVKIDGSFVADILNNGQSLAMVRAIVSLTKDLGIGTVAEYAENRKIIEQLRELGVQYAQGYGVERPRAFEDVLLELSLRDSQETFASSQSRFSGDRPRDSLTAAQFQNSR